MKPSSHKLFVLDTNVLMHDPSSIYRFEEHDIYIPIVVLEELDVHKTGLSEVARNVRQISRNLDELVATVHGDIVNGVPMPAPEGRSKRTPDSDDTIFTFHALPGAGQFSSDVRGATHRRLAPHRLGSLVLFR